MGMGKKKTATPSWRIRGFAFLDTYYHTRTLAYFAPTILKRLGIGF